MTKDELVSFLRKHRLGVLATVSPSGEPESAVVGIAVTERVEIIFDTVKTSRKWKNLQANPKISFVVGWDHEITVQYEGIADEPQGEELNRVQGAYFTVFPDGPQRLSWPGITYFRVRPTWARYSDFNAPGKIHEFTRSELEV